MIKKLFRFLSGDKFIFLRDLDKDDFNRISYFESIDWRVEVIRNGGIYKRDWLKIINDEKKGIKRKTKIKIKKIKISKEDYEIISKITDTGYVILNFPAMDKIGRLSRVDRILLDHLSDKVKGELLKSRFRPNDLDEIEYIDLLVFLDNVVID